MDEQPPIQQPEVMPVQVAKQPFYKRKIVVGIGLGLILLLCGVVGSVFLASSSMQKEEPVSPTPIPKPTLKPFPPKEGYVPDELIIQFIQGQSPEVLEPSRKEDLQNLFDQVGVLSYEKLYQTESGELANYYLFKFKESVNVEEASKQIYALPEVKHAEPNVIIKSF